MSCCCGHAHWHCDHLPGYPPGGYPPPVYPPSDYGPPRGLRRRVRRSRMEDLEDYLQDLEAELTRVREELTAYRRDEGGQE